MGEFDGNKINSPVTDLGKKMQEKGIVLSETEKDVFGKLVEEIGKQKKTKKTPALSHPPLVSPQEIAQKQNADFESAPKKLEWSIGADMLVADSEKKRDKEKKLEEFRQKVHPIFDDLKKSIKEHKDFSKAYQGDDAKKLEKMTNGLNALEEKFLKKAEFDEMEETEHTKAELEKEIKADLLARAVGGHLSKRLALIVDDICAEKPKVEDGDVSENFKGIDAGDLMAFHEQATAEAAPFSAGEITEPFVLGPIIEDEPAQEKKPHKLLLGKFYEKYGNILGKTFYEDGDLKKERVKVVEYDPKIGKVLLSYKEKGWKDSKSGLFPLNEIDNFLKRGYKIVKESVAVKKETAVSSEAGKIETAAEKEEKYKDSRKASEWTLDRLEDPDNKTAEGMKYEDFNAATMEEGDKKFLDVVRKIWDKFGVHGAFRGGKFVMDTDLDGKGSIELLRLAGFNEKALAKEALKYVEQGSAGDLEEGRIYADTGGIDGFEIKGKNFYGDHHASYSTYGTSSTRNYYKMLVDMGLLQKTEKLDRMVEFVTRMDNGDYPRIENYFKNSWKTVAGLERYMSRESLVKFFLEDSNPDPTRELTVGELKKYGFASVESKQRNVAKKSQERLSQMEKDGFVISSERYGKIAISIEDGNGGKDLPGDFLAARAFGCDVYVIWNPKENRFKISSKKPIKEKYPQGMGVRETMWIKNNNDNSPLQVSLQEILTKMTDGKMVSEGKLKQYLDNPENFLKENNFETIFGKEIIEKAIKASKKYYEDTLRDIAALPEWKNEKEYKKEARRVSEMDTKDFVMEILTKIVATKKIEVTFDADKKEKFARFILDKI